MAITVVANPASPYGPRFEITMTSSDGSTITAVTLTRTAAGMTDSTRVQPAPGPSPRTVADYEAPWGTPVVFTATVTSTAGTETFTAAGSTLAVAVPWIIHPTTPALSRVLDAGAFASMGVMTIGAVTRAATTTGHEILGSKYRVMTKTGPRAASRTQLEVATVTADEHQALFALVDDQTPLLIRVPAGWAWDWEDGYYDVGEVTAARFFQYGPERRRVFTLPLERVEAPAGTQQSPRTWADLLAGFPTWSAVAGAYATWTDVLTDTRR